MSTTKKLKHAYLPQLSAARHETDEIDDEVSKDSSKRNKEPHLKNLNEDPMLSGVVFHFLSEKSTIFGRKDGNPDIVLTGLRYTYMFYVDKLYTC